jgi:hypothetical protein
MLPIFTPICLKQVLNDGSEPLPDFRYGKQEAIEARIAAPQQRFYGRLSPLFRRESGTRPGSIDGTYFLMGTSAYPSSAYCHF